MRLGNWITVILIAFTCIVHGQSDGVENIVPNAGFEEYSTSPLGWYYTGRDFTRVLKYWESPTGASPDVYGPRSYIPSEWQLQGFGKSKAIEGSSMVGLTLYGCEEGKPHCREYVQIQLIEPLVVGQKYRLSYKVKHLPRSIRVRNIGVVFREERVHDTHDHILEYIPDYTPDHTLVATGSDWATVTGEFHAASAANYMIIGNFTPDSLSTTQTCECDDGLQFAYYYLDDVSVTKLPPIIPVPEDPDALIKADIKTGNTIALNNIYFDHDREDFLPRSYRELNTLLKIMNANPDLTIEIHGHTDNVGSVSYNYNLSFARANAVVDYLTSNGISISRVSSKAFGAMKPIAPNDTEEGRQKNRRVEFLVLTH